MDTSTSSVNQTSDESNIGTVISELDICIGNQNNNIITSYFTNASSDTNSTNTVPVTDPIEANEVCSFKSMCMSFISEGIKFTLTKKMKDELGSNSVVNLSDFVLEPRHVSLLSKGLTFCPTPGVPCMGDLRRDLDNFHQKAHFGKKQDKNLAWNQTLKESQLRNSQSLMSSFFLKSRGSGATITV